MNRTPIDEDLIVIAEAVDEVSAATAAPPTAGNGLRAAPCPPVNEPAGHREYLPVRWRELLAVVVAAVLADVVVYRGHGFAGVAAAMVAVPFLLVAGSPWRRFSPGLAIVAALSVVAAAKLAWCGTGLLVAVGFGLLVATAMLLAGLRPYLLPLLALAVAAIPAGIANLALYATSSRQLASWRPRVAWLGLVLPLAAAAAFGTIFVLANPDIASYLGRQIEVLYDQVADFLTRFSPTTAELLVCGVAALMMAGWLRPPAFLAGRPEQPGTGAPARPVSPTAATPLYAAYRNTLVTVIVLFAAYLVFEFQTLWFREFPPGFYYSGYAHEGAAWLTAALALATGILSVVFRGSVFGDPRIAVLRRLAWIWSLENLVLAVAVYHRLGIYIGFNGMTRMRVVGLLGISAVAVGFVLVVFKIVRRHRFGWLFQRHLWTLAAAVYLYAVLPVDLLVHRYNVARILAGDPAPAVQISVHPISAEGYLVLKGLLKSHDRIIREGVRAMLSERRTEAEAAWNERRRLGWTAYQAADELLLVELRSRDWQPYTKADEAERALARFHAYAYQWY